MGRRAAASFEGDFIFAGYFIKRLFHGAIIRELGAGHFWCLVDAAVVNVKMRYAITNTKWKGCSMIIGIDGPAGAGKSTISKMIAKELGFSCLDTGAMFRSVAWKALQEGVSIEDDAALGAIARENQISFTFDDNADRTQHVFIGGVEVTNFIRTPEIDKVVSPVSAAPSVREALLVQQRRIGAEGNYVVEGRDICTTVFPQAEVKVFLTASAEERARRRMAQNEARGMTDETFEEILADIIRRDEADSTREISPLRQAEDATLVDSSDMTIEEVVKTICDMARQA